MGFPMSYWGPGPNPLPPNSSTALHITHAYILNKHLSQDTGGVKTEGHQHIEYSGAGPLMLVCFLFSLTSEFSPQRPC